jgi:hypothetical protein
LPEGFAEQWRIGDTANITSGPIRHGIPPIADVFIVGRLKDNVLAKSIGFRQEHVLRPLS